MKAAIKKFNITPPVGIEMCGFSERNHGCEGIHDDIYAVILVIDDGKKKTALVACDVLGIDANVAKSVRDIVSSKSDIKPEFIMINATHTHSSVDGSALKGFRMLPSCLNDIETKEAYYQQFIQKIANGILNTLHSLKPAKIGFGKGNLKGLGTNRNDVNAYFDTTVNVIRVDNLDDSPMGIITSYACHPTVLNQNNYLITADYPGYFRNEIEAVFPGVTAMFMQGAAGSASTRFVRKSSTFEEAHRLSLLLAGETIKTAAEIKTTDKIDVNAKLNTIELDVKDFPKDEECEKDINKYENLLSKMKKENADPAEIRKTYVTLQGAQRNYNIKKRINFDKVNSEMQYIDFGIFSIVTIPGDVFAEIGRDIREMSQKDNMFVVGYTNDFVGYIVSKEGYKMNCYERLMSIFDIRAHEEILKSAEKLLK